MPFRRLMISQLAFSFSPYQSYGIEAVELTLPADPNNPSRALLLSPPNVSLYDFFNPFKLIADSSLTNQRLIILNHSIYFPFFYFKFTWNYCYSTNFFKYLYFFCTYMYLVLNMYDFFKIFIKNLIIYNFKKKIISTKKYTNFQNLYIYFTLNYLFSNF